MAEDLPDGFDFVHARYLVEWLPDKALALQRMIKALRPGGMLLDEEPDWVTIFETPESAALRHVMVAGMRYLESTCPINTEYGRRLVDDLTAAGLADVAAEGRTTIVRGGKPAGRPLLAADDREVLCDPLIAGGRVRGTESSPRRSPRSRIRRSASCSRSPSRRGAAGHRQLGTPAQPPPDRPLRARTDQADGAGR